jgi:hypothetical protein
MDWWVIPKRSKGRVSLASTFSFDLNIDRYIIFPSLLFWELPLGKHNNKEEFHQYEPKKSKEKRFLYVINSEIILNTITQPDTVDLVVGIAYTLRLDDRVRLRNDSFQKKKKRLRNDYSTFLYISLTSFYKAFLFIYFFYQSTLSNIFKMKSMTHVGWGVGEVWKM